MNIRWQVTLIDCIALPKRPGGLIGAPGEGGPWGGGRWRVRAEHCRKDTYIHGASIQHLAGLVSEVYDGHVQDGCMLRAQGLPLQSNHQRGSQLLRL